MSRWAEDIAKKIIDRAPEKDEYVCAAGISPSGSVHIGNFRDIATSYFVVKALRRLGKKAKLLFSWDEFDRMRKVPSNVAAIDGDMGKYIGFPYVDVPDPFGDGHSSFAEHFEKEFMTAVEKFGIDMDYRYQSQMYRSGKYVEYIKTALEKRKQIFDIIDSHRTQDAAEGERDNYYPVSIYCPKCHRDTTKITSLAPDNTRAEYECKCGHHGTFDFTKDFNCKLAWKVDWPMRWAYEGVDFEPGGKDHASPDGSYNTSKEIAVKIFGIKPPVFQGYEFIGIRGATGKMSSSSGLNLTPATMLSLYQPEIILWLYSKTEPLKAFDFCFDDGILRQYFEFDKMLGGYRQGSLNEHDASVMQDALIDGRDIKTVPMGLLVQLGSVVNFNEKMLETVFAKIGTPYTRDEFADRLQRARFWLEKCAPDQVNTLRRTRNFDVFSALDDAQKKEVAMLHDYLKKGGYTLDELNSELYAIPKRVFGDTLAEKELKAVQGDFFKTVYKLLIDKEKGPRLYLFLYAIDPNEYVKLLDFSYPQTQEEMDAEKPVATVDGEQKQPSEKVALGEPDPVEPIKPAIDYDAFDALDLRVCKIVKAQEIRKSATCLKLTLDDGLSTRVIVSSISRDYTCEELVGKKIVVLVNLEPKRIAGVSSDGMLLATTNSASGCNLLFIDDIVPVGTKIK